MRGEARRGGVLPSHHHPGVKKNGRPCASATDRWGDRCIIETVLAGSIPPREGDLTTEVPRLARAQPARRVGLESVRRPSPRLLRACQGGSIDPRLHRAPVGEEETGIGGDADHGAEGDQGDRRHREHLSTLVSISSARFLRRERGSARLLTLSWPRARAVASVYVGDAAPALSKMHAAAAHPRTSVCKGAAERPARRRHAPSLSTQTAVDIGRRRGGCGGRRGGTGHSKRVGRHAACAAAAHGERVGGRDLSGGEPSRWPACEPARDASLQEANCARRSRSSRARTSSDLLVPAIRWVGTQLRCR